MWRNFQTSMFPTYENSATFLKVVRKTVLHTCPLQAACLARKPLSGDPAPNARLLTLRPWARASHTATDGPQHAERCEAPLSLRRATLFH